MNSKRWLVALTHLIAFVSVALPRAALAVPGDENWDDRFYFNGADNRIDALTTYGGSLYAAGRFQVIGSVGASGIARWDGTKWLAVGGGLRGSSSALLVSGPDLIVGGSFTRAGNVAATNIARWDGSQWSGIGQLPGGLFDGVNALAELNGEIYAGGSFKQVNGSPANYIARWNGSNWTTVGTGVNGTVYALYTLGNYVYVGGSFSQAGGLAANGIARFNGIWSPLGSGLNASAQVYALAARGTNLYVGGTFTQAGGLNSPNLAGWFDDGVSAQWQTVGAPGATIYGLRGIADRLYVGGRFASIGGTNAVNIALLNSTGWLRFGSGLSGSGFGPQVSAIEEFGTDVFGGGVFQTAGGTVIPNIARWNGAQWKNPGPTNGLGFDNSAHAVALVGTNEYVVGSFTQAGTTPVVGAAHWTGNGWERMDSGLPSLLGTIYYAASIDTNLYAGGSPVRRWNGAAWTPLGFGATGPVAVSGTNLYAVLKGFQTLVGRWNGSTWQPLGTNFINTITPEPLIFGLVATGEVVYAAGYFQSVGANAATNIAKWDGTQWAGLARGFPVTRGFANTLALALYGNSLLVGTLDNSGTNSIYRWDGAAWSTMPGVFTTGGAVSGAVWLQTIVPDGTNVYVGGRFSFVDGQPAEGIAWWDGTTWHGLGSGLNALVYDIAVQGNSVYAVGEFSSAGGKGSSHFAIWNRSANALPRLSINFATNGFRLAWPGSVVSAVVESTASLQAPDWRQTVGVGNVANGQNTFDVTQNGQSSFYRLRLP
jgi:Domain of unknown function (DUF5122) beta-propeller